MDIRCFPCLGAGLIEKYRIYSPDSKRRGGMGLTSKTKSTSPVSTASPESVTSPNPRPPPESATSAESSAMGVQSSETSSLLRKSVSSSPWLSTIEMRWTGKTQIYQNSLLSKNCQVLGTSKVTSTALHGGWLNTENSLRVVSISVWGNSLAFYHKTRFSSRWSALHVLQFL